jgi:hypothetical protein
MAVQSNAYGLSIAELIALRNEGEQYNKTLTAVEAREKGIIHDIVDRFDFLKEE